MLLHMLIKLEKWVYSETLRLDLANHFVLKSLPKKNFKTSAQAHLNIGKHVCALFGVVRSSKNATLQHVAKHLMHHSQSDEETILVMCKDYEVPSFTSETCQACIETV